MTLWEATFNRYQKTPPQDKAARGALHKDLTQQLTALLQEEWPLAQHQQLIRQAFLLGARAEGITLLRALALREKQPGKAAAIYESAAREALATSNYQLCAELYILARRSAPDAQSAKNHYLSAVAAMQSSGRAEAALELAWSASWATSMTTPKPCAWWCSWRVRPDGRTSPSVTSNNSCAWRSCCNGSNRQAEAVQSMPPAMQPTMARNANPAPSPRYEDRALVFLDPALLRTPSSPYVEGSAHFVRTNQKQIADTKAGPGLPFDDKTYTLGYSVFLENRNLEDAWLVARQPCSRPPTTWSGVNAWPRSRNGLCASKWRWNTGSCWRGAPRKMRPGRLFYA